MTGTTIQTMQALLALTKPRIILLVLFTALPVMAMGTAGWPCDRVECQVRVKIERK